MSMSAVPTTASIKEDPRLGALRRDAEARNSKTEIRSKFKAQNLKFKTDFSFVLNILILNLGFASDFALRIYIPEEIE
jgi:hypothetical protein